MSPTVLSPVVVHHRALNDDEVPAGELEGVDVDWEQPGENRESWSSDSSVGLQAPESDDPPDVGRLDADRSDGEPSVAGAEPELVGYFNSGLLLKGLVTALAKACREGIPAEQLSAFATIRSAGRTTVLDSSADKRKLWEAELADYTVRVDRAMELAMSTDDAESRADYKKKEEAARAAVRRVRSKLSDLEAEAAVPSKVETFATYTDMVTAALTRTALSKNRVSQQQLQALKTVMPQFEMRRDELSQWTASAIIRLNLVGGGVADFGPIYWPVGPGGRGSGVRQSRSATDSGRESRKVLHARLRATGRVSQSRCLLLLNANFAELPYVVLNGTVGHPFPDWVGPEWRAEPFRNWVTGWYTDTEAWWRSVASYASFSRERQLLAHLAADHGTVTGEQLREIAPGFNHQRLRRFASDTGEANQRPWYRAVILAPSSSTARTAERATASSTGRRTGRTASVITSVICACGEPARVVARVPEVPRCLLCECGRMPEAARFGMDPAVRFPRAYQEVLMLSQAECLAEVTRSFDPRLRPQSEQASQILAQRDLLERGAAAAELADRIGVDRRAVHAVLMRLHAQRLVRRTGERQQLWALPLTESDSD